MRKLRRHRGSLGEDGDDSESWGDDGDEPDAFAGEDAQPDDDMPLDDVTEELPPEDSDLAADPHSKRAGAREKAASKRGPVAFRAPTGQEGVPVHRSRRPAESTKAKLAVAFVRHGRVVDRPAPLLELGSLLESEAGIALVLALGHPATSEVGLAELAAQAKGEGRDLLLVDVSDGTDRVGYLLHARSGVVLGRYEGDEGTPVSGTARDLCERIGRSYVALKTE